MKICFYDMKPYDIETFDMENKKYGFICDYHEEKLNPFTATFAKGCKAVCAFVNDDISAKTIDNLAEIGVELLAMRCAGFNNVDLKAAKDKLLITRVPAYSPYSVAEHAMGLLLTINRKIHKAYFRTRDFNFNINGFTGFDLHQKTVGVIGTGKIGRCFIDICKGFGMKVLAYDPFPTKDYGIEYVELEELFRESLVISLHCPLSKSNYHIIDRKSIEQMKKGAIIINTSRGALIDSEALLDGLISQKLGGTGLDVYEEEADMFY